MNQNTWKNNEKEEEEKKSRRSIILNNDRWWSTFELTKKLHNTKITAIEPISEIYTLIAVICILDQKNYTFASF